MDRLCLALGLVALLGFVQAEGDGPIKCFVCSSKAAGKDHVPTAENYDGPACDDSEKLLENKDAWMKTCEPPHGPFNSTVCRKLTQTVESIRYVTRQCGSDWRESHPCVERTGTENIKLRNCECKGDGCNQGSSTTVSVLLVGVVSALLALHFHF